jgi:hypothetical protein
VFFFYKKEPKNFLLLENLKNKVFDGSENQGFSVRSKT